MKFSYGILENLILFICTLFVRILQKFSYKQSKYMLNIKQEFTFENCSPNSVNAAQNTRSLKLLVNQTSSSVQSSPQKYKCQRRKRKPRACYKLWDTEQNKIFMEFLQSNIESFDALSSRRSKKVFVQMQKLFTDRTSQHCKSHYQKLQKMAKSKNVNQVIKYLQRKQLKEKKTEQKQVRMEEISQRKLDEMTMIVVVKSQKRVDIKIQCNLDDICEW